jgi:glycine/D-amino acid oxidase-like deaminating enzyme
LYRAGVERVVVVGAGTFGASLAWWLARRGDEVVLVDRFEPGDARATSGGETRLLRCSHGADADYARMARRATTLWRKLEAESGEDLLAAPAAELGRSGIHIALPLRRQNSALVGFLVLESRRSLPRHVELALRETLDELGAALADKPAETATAPLRPVVLRAS